jgi:hypothetical protein
MNMTHSENGARLPDLPDMMAMGMGLTEALAFWNEMMNSRQKSVSYWWDQIRVRTSATAAPVLH